MAWCGALHSVEMNIEPTLLPSPFFLLPSSSSLSRNGDTITNIGDSFFLLPSSFFPASGETPLVSSCGVLMESLDDINGLNGLSNELSSQEEKDVCLLNR